MGHPRAVGIQALAGAAQKAARALPVLRPEHQGALMAAPALAYRHPLLPPTRRPPDVYADEVLPVVDGPRRGQRLSLISYQREIMQSLGEPGIEFVDVMGSAQWGKTLLGLTYLAWTIQESPTSILYILPTVTMASEFSRERLDVLIRSTPSLLARVDTRRSADGINTLLSKTFRGGLLALVGAKTSIGLSSRPIQRLVMDEIDKYAGGGLVEGSPIREAEKRTVTFQSRRTIYATSTPRMKNGAIHTRFKAGDRRYFHVPCPLPGCEWVGRLTWEMVRWEAEDGSDAAIHCEACGHRWSDADRYRSVAVGQWVAEVAEGVPGRRSYHIWAAYSPFASIPGLASEYLEAAKDGERGDMTALITFKQATLGLPVSEADDLSPSAGRLRRELLARRGPLEVPEHARVVAAADVHGDRIEVLVSAWSDQRECWMLDLRVLYGKPDEGSVWQQLDELRMETFGGLSIERLHIDSGYSANEVYDYALPRQRDGVFAIKGYSDPAFVTAPRKPEKGPRGRKCVLLVVGTDEGKSLVMRSLALDGERTQVHLPMAPWCNAEFVAQLTSERLEQVRQKGRTVNRWLPIRERNEALDLLVYSRHACQWLRRK